MNVFIAEIMVQSHALNNKLPMHVPNPPGFAVKSRPKNFLEAESDATTLHRKQLVQSTVRLHDTANIETNYNPFQLN